MFGDTALIDIHGSFCGISSTVVLEKTAVLIFLVTSVVKEAQVTVLVFKILTEMRK